MAKLIVETRVVKMFCGKHREHVDVIQHEDGKIEHLNTDHQHCYSLLDPRKMSKKQKDEWGVTA